MAASRIDEGTVPNPLHPDDIAGAATIVLAVPGALYAEALARMLREHGLRVVGWSESRAALVEKCRRCRPGVVIVDASLAGADDGPCVLFEELRAAAPASRLVVLAGEVDATLARAAMQCTVSAIILRSSPTVDAVATLLQVIRGRTSFPASVLSKLSERSRDRDLSDRQFEVLERLARGRSNLEIARELYISPNTVKFHVRSIYDRLGVHNRVDAARLLADRHAH